MTARRVVVASALTALLAAALPALSSPAVAGIGPKLRVELRAGPQGSHHVRPAGQPEPDYGEVLTPEALLERSGKQQQGKPCLHAVLSDHRWRRAHRPCAWRRLRPCPRVHPGCPSC